MSTLVEPSDIEIDDGNRATRDKGTVSSPTSVLAAQEVNPGVVIEPIALGGGRPCQEQEQEHQQEDEASISTRSTCTADEEEWSCPASAKSVRTVNPIRALVDPFAKDIQTGEDRGDGKDLISLALGDPTVGGNLPPCPQAIRAIVSAVEKSPHAAGYVNACGTTAAREAIARYHSYPQHSIDADSVIVANGCSGALELALTAVLDPGTIILVPQPGFPLYQVIAESHGASVLHYRLDPDRQWEVDLDHLEQLLEQQYDQEGPRGGSKLIRGIIVNNPSNPTGGVFSKSHLAQIINFCQRHRLPIVADEVYGNLVFGENTFHPVAQVAAELGRKVPVITASGLAKQFLLPGWRIGWITFHDNIHKSLAEVEAGAKRLAQVILGASHLAQSAIPALLTTDDPDLAAWKQHLRDQLEDQAAYLCSQLASKCSSLDVISPQGAMYAMVRISTEELDIAHDMEFATLLLKEENVFVLPGSAFGMPNVFRVVFCSSKPILEQAAHRIGEFCDRHSNRT